MDPDNEALHEQMKDVCEYFMEANKPRNFNPRSSGSVVVEFDKSFENMCSSMQESGITPDSLTVFEFYSKIEYFEKKYEKVKRHGTNKQI